MVSCHGAMHYILLLILSIRVLQNRIVRTMLFKPFDTRIRPLFSELNLLTIKDLFNFEIAKLVHKFHTVSLPDVFNCHFSYVSSATRSSTRNNLIVKRTNKEIGKRSSSYTGAVVWNAIPNEIRTLQFNGFSKAYKNNLLEAYMT